MWRVAAILVALLSFSLAARAAAGSHFNPDESRWLSRAHYLQDLADPFGPTWADQYMTRGQPPLGSYVMGIGLLMHGRDLQTNPPWDFSLPWEVNSGIGNKPVAEDLTAGRRTSAALVALTTLAVIALARTFVSVQWAIAAGALFAIHPFTIYIGSLATSDALFGFLIALAALAAASLARRPTVLHGVLLGVLLGLGAATKLSPLVLALGIGGTAALALVIDRRWPGRLPGGIRALALPGIVAGFAAVLTFVAVYPYLWFNPVERTGHLFAFRIEEMATQASDWPVMAVPNRAEALHRIGINFGERYSLSTAVGSWLEVASVPPFFRHAELLLPLAGTVIMFGMAARAGPTSPQALVAAVLAGQVLITIAGMRSEFDRYHVPMALLGAVGSATALACLAHAFTHMAGWRSFAASPIGSVAASVPVTGALQATKQLTLPSPARASLSPRMENGKQSTRTAGVEAVSQEQNRK